jgi:hypothetical protein
MKYNRMLCWVRPHEKRELKKAVNSQFPLEFAKNYEDFELKINKNDYLVISLSKVKFGFVKIRKLINKFSKFNFKFYEVKEHDELISKQILIMDEKNVTNGQYSADELKDNYLGVIKDLWYKRQSDDISPIIIND